MMTSASRSTSPACAACCRARTSPTLSPVYIDERGEISFYAGDLTVPGYRKSLLSGVNFVALSCEAHTTEMYRGLPHGWRMTPTGVPTDLYMWQQFLSEPKCRTTGGTRPTVLQFPSPLRHDQPLADRLTELENRSRNLQDPGWRDAFALRVLDRHVRTRAEDTMKLNEELEARRRPRARLRVSIHAREQQISELKSDLADERRRVQHLEVKAIESSRSWKLRLGRMKSRILESGK